MKLHVIFEDGSIADLENVYSMKLFTEGKPRIVHEKTEPDCQECAISTISLATGSHTITVIDGNYNIKGIHYKKVVVKE